jgi:hypothetical protein
MSAKLVEITARKPHCASARGACSRELQQPRLSPASRICRPCDSGRTVKLPINNVDTDQIIPARSLKTASKLGLDTQLFNDWRHDPDFLSLDPFAARRRVSDCAQRSSNGRWTLWKTRPVSFLTCMRSFSATAAPIVDHADHRSRRSSITPIVDPCQE